MWLVIHTIFSIEAFRDPFTNNMGYIILIIAQVYRLSAVHCQMTRYSQRVPGYLTRYSVSANETSFDKKNQQIILCLSNQVRPGRKWLPSPLGDLNRLFEDPNWWIIQNMTLKYVLFFKMTPVWPLKCEFVSLLCWLKQAECSVHFTIKK